ncbi:GATA transcription factor [Striga asiatica]|uniref:GATA transcription factor n=1 Tax=Striga asiatica TaxID=4170 RepID=A0A5A7Q7F2_STRAF|nr:GATA transcription factor [Striga asiatica]
MDNFNNNRSGKRPLDLTLRLRPASPETERDEEIEAANNSVHTSLSNMGYDVTSSSRLAVGSYNYCVIKPARVRVNRGRVYDGRICQGCGRWSTPLWRKGPDGPQTLCNACGLREMRANKKNAGESATQEES